MTPDVESPALKDEDIISCTHEDANGESHLFEFSDYHNRTIWNPYHPKCKRCGKSIQEIIHTHRQTQKKLAAVVRGLLESATCDAGYGCDGVDCWIHHPEHIYLMGEQVVEAFAPLLEKEKEGEG